MELFDFKDILDSKLIINDEYKSKLNYDCGMKTSFWGPHMWTSMFSIIHVYPIKINFNDKIHINKQKQYYNFFKSLCVLLPCSFCRESYCFFWKKYKIKKHMKSRESLFLWLYNLKRLVNRKLMIQEKQKLSLMLESKLSAKINLNYQYFKIDLSKKKLICIYKEPLPEEVIRFYFDFRVRNK
jgi:hypothetical protein